MKLRDKAFAVAERAARSVVRRRLSGYRVEVTSGDVTKPHRLAAPRRVAVVGGGLAGCTAAEVLAARGYEVTLYERSGHLGGKVGGAGIVTDPEGRPIAIDHGFHAFFRHYENLNRFLARAGVAPMRAIEDYVVVDSNGAVSRFGEIETTPLLNILSLAKHGFYRFGEVAPPRTRRRMHEFLQYDPDRTFRDLDDESFASFAERAALPPKLRRVFTTFGRAFFTDERRLSTAELIKAFHFYYLSHDRGLLYDYPVGSAEQTLVLPLERRLRGLGVRLALGQSVDSIEPTASSIIVADEHVDAVVLATHANAARAIALASPSFAKTFPKTYEQLTRIEPGGRYAVMRVWLDADPCARLPVFLTTDRIRLLDAVASYHRITKDDHAWAERTGGAALELHSYSVPEDLPDAKIEEAFIAELREFFPKAIKMRVLGSHLVIRDDFTSRHVGAAKSRPGTETDDPRLVLAGDWVSLPVPALLMEAACTSGIFAANAIMARDRLSPEPIYSVPLRGLFA